MKLSLPRGGRSHFEYMKLSLSREGEKFYVHRKFIY